MSTQTKKLNFLVFGATGCQGSSVIRALVKTKKYHVKGIARDVNSDRAREIKDLGVELVHCDMRKPDELRNVMKGIDLVYAMTDYWDHESKNKEYQIGKNIVDVAVEMKVKHFIWSSLPNVEHLSGGKLTVPHFSHKGRVGEYAKKLLPTTLVCPGFYYQNFSGELLHHKREADGTIIYNLPKVSALPGMDINDIGEIIKNIADNYKDYVGKCIPLAGDSMPLEKYIQQMNEFGGMKVKLNPISYKEYAKLNVEGAHEMAEMFEWIDTFGYFGTESDLTLGRSLGHLKTFKEFLQTSKINPK